MEQSRNIFAISGLDGIIFFVVQLSSYHNETGTVGFEKQEKVLK
jgi:hypothetical protein